jgi:hypothetical protein
MRKQRWAWYLLICGAAVISTEGLSWSTPIAYPLGIFAIIIYAIHYLLILDYLLEKRALSLRSLAIGGLLVGITTESFLTKVIWNAPWNDGQMPRVLGIGVYELGFVVNVWHTWMTMFVPFALVYTIFGHSALFSPKIMRRILLALPFTVLLPTAFNGVNWYLVLVPPLLNGLGFAATVYLYRHYQKQHGLQRAEEFRLTTGERRVIWGIVIAAYILLTPIGGKGLGAIESPIALLLGCFFVLLSFYLFFAVVRADAGKMPDPLPETFGYRDLLRYILYFELIALLCALLTATVYAVSALIVLAALLITSLLGNIWLIRQLWQSRTIFFSKRNEEATLPLGSD